MFLRYVGNGARVIACFFGMSAAVFAVEPFEVGGVVVRPTESWESVEASGSERRLLRLRDSGDRATLALQVRTLDGSVLVTDALAGSLAQKLGEMLADGGREGRIESFVPSAVDGAPAWRARARWRIGDRELVQSFVLIAAEKPVLIVLGSTPEAVELLDPAVDKLVADMTVRRPPRLAAAWPVALCGLLAGGFRWTRRRCRQEPRS